MDDGNLISDEKHSGGYIKALSAGTSLSKVVMMHLKVKSGCQIRFNTSVSLVFAS